MAERIDDTPWNFWPDFSKRKTPRAGYFGAGNPAGVS